MIIDPDGGEGVTSKYDVLKLPIRGMEIISVCQFADLSKIFAGLDLEWVKGSKSHVNVIYECPHRGEARRERGATACAVRLPA